MKNKYLPVYLILFTVTAAIFSACGMKHVAINTMRPAEINVPQHVDTLLLLNRTQFKSQAGNILEGILTGEMPGEDKAGTQAAMSTLQENLSYTGRYYVKNAEEVLNGNSISAAFPDALDWDLIGDLCEKYNTNGVLAIEIFDTDFIVTNGKRKAKKEVTENGVKKTIEVDEYYAEGIANITVGFRLYDPKTKTIVDQNLMTRSNTWNAAGNSVQEAVAQLVVKTEATRYVSKLAGEAYAYKISPMPVRLSREFYGKSKRVDLVKVGTRQAEVNDWVNALETWKKAFKQAKEDKDKGRIAYNIAIAYEVLSDLENAKLWCKISYVDFGNKKARQYANILDQRSYDLEVLKQQLGE
ncbi:MAG TPA: DUF6340 family protein [Bacteroidia bacterium]|nr:DUF6340 family protein [Bacteroidia bacterium]